MNKRLIQDDITDAKIIESEDGVGTMTYTAMHPYYRYGKNIKCPFCNKTIDLRR